MLSCVIVDDELHCIDAFAAILKQKFPQRVQVIGTASDPEKAIPLIQQSAPDILFLDVEMPGCSGLQLLKQVEQANLSVVFTTAHERYALEALKNEATDYLLKPISVYELTGAIEKCEKKAALLQVAEKNAEPNKKLILSTLKGSQLYSLEEIIRLEGSNNYCTVFFVGQPKLVVSKTLKTFEEQLQDKGFFRVHQSHLINLQHLRSYQNGEPDVAVLSDGSRVEIARRRKADFLRAIATI